MLLRQAVSLFNNIKPVLTVEDLDDSDGDEYDEYCFKEGGMPAYKSSNKEEMSLKEAKGYSLKPYNSTCAKLE